MGNPAFWVVQALCVNAKRCPSGRHIHQPVCVGEFEGRGEWKAGTFCRLDSMQGDAEFKKVRLNMDSRELREQQLKQGSQ